MDFTGTHITASGQFEREDLDLLFRVADSMLPYAQKNGVSDLMKGKVLATLFFEPSTRTRFSFETAMLRLGGHVINNYLMNETSSITKWESLYDTGRTVSQFADVIAMRHPEAGAVEELAKGSTVPVISCGDGAHDHPTQGLLDVYTLYKEKGRIDGLKIAMVGDLKYSRVVHSQSQLLRNYKNIELVLVSPKELELPEDLVSELKDSGFKVTVTEDFEAVVGDLDVISMARIQKERFPDMDEYEKFKGVYVLTLDLLRKAKQDALVMAPLPRVDEIDIACDGDPRCKYFEQVQYGVAVRMALLALVLGLR